MIKNPEALEQFEREYRRAHPSTLGQKYALLEAMDQFARMFGHLGEVRMTKDIEKGS